MTESRASVSGIRSSRASRLNHPIVEVAREAQHVLHGRRSLRLRGERDAYFPFVGAEIVQHDRRDHEVHAG